MLYWSPPPHPSSTHDLLNLYLSLLLRSAGELTTSSSRSNGTSPTRARRQKWKSSVGSQSIDDDILLSKSGTKLLGEDGPQQVSILETLNEASESPQTKEPQDSLADKPAAVQPTPAITISYSQELPAQRKDKEIQKEGSQEGGGESEAKVTSVESEASAAAPSTTAQSAGEESPQLGADGVVRRTGTSSEKKKSRRIRTKSQVETII